MDTTGKKASVIRMAERKPQKKDERVWVHLLVIAVLTIAVYYNSLANGFVGDDISFVKENISIRSLSNVPAFFLSPRSLASDAEWGTIIYRPLRTVSYAIDYAIYGLNPWGYHLTSLLFHLASVIALYFLVANLFAIPMVAFLSAILFAIHPVHTEAVSWIASRADLMGFTLLSLSLLSYMRYRGTQKAQWLVLSAALSFLTYLAKETMVVLPGLVILYDYIQRDGKTVFGKIRSNMVPWAIFSAVCLAYMVIRFQITGRMSTTQGWWGGSVYSNFLMMAKATAAYMRLIIAPYGLTFHYIIDPVNTLMDGRVIASIAAILSALGLTVFFYFRNRLVFFSLAWFFIGLVPIANIIPISFSMMAERYIYMASAGPIMAIAYGCFRLHRKAFEKGYGGAAVAAGVVIALLFSAMVVARNKDYKDESAFYTSAVSVSPGSAPSHKGLADQYYQKKDYVRALEHYGRAVEIDPGYVEALIGQAVVYMDTKDIAGAVVAAERAAGLEEKIASLKSKRAIVRFNLGNVYREAGSLERARAEWEKAVEANPDYSEAYNNLGNYHLLNRDPQSAIRMFTQAARVNPYNAETHYNMAMAYEAVGDGAKAREHYKRFSTLAGSEYKDVIEELKRRGVI